MVNKLILSSVSVVIGCDSFYDEFDRCYSFVKRCNIVFPSLFCYENYGLTGENILINFRDYFFEKSERVYEE